MGERACSPTGVGCVTADAMSHFAFLFRDPQALANGTMVETEHPSFGGRYWRHAPMLRFSETPGEARPHCELGEHTRAILAGTGVRPVGDDRPAATPTSSGGRRRTRRRCRWDRERGRRVASPATVRCTRTRGGRRRWRGTSKTRSRSSLVQAGASVGRSHWSWQRRARGWWWPTTAGRSTPAPAPRADLRTKSWLRSRVTGAKRSPVSRMCRRCRAVRRSCSRPSTTSAGWTASPAVPGSWCRSSSGRWTNATGTT